jgi:hypothetical protein
MTSRDRSEEREAGTTILNADLPDHDRLPIWIVDN